MVDSVKNYGITGVAANVELGKQGAVISGTSADSINLVDSEGNVVVAQVAAGTSAEHAANKSQLDLLALPKLSYRQFTVNYDSGTIALANVTANSYIHRTVIEAASEWTDADSNTTITVGDSANNARLFTDFDPDVQTNDEADYRYSTETTVSAYVTQGGATAGNAYVTLWYSGTLVDPPEAAPAAPVVSSGLILHLDAGNVASYPGTGATWTNLVDDTDYTISNGAFDSGDGGSIVFNGTSTFVPVGTLLNNDANFTKEAWVNADVVTNARNILSSANNVFWNNGSTLSGGAGGSFSLVTSANFPTAVWRHVVLTFDDASNTMRLYINGTQVSENTGVTQSYVSEIERIGAHFSSGNPVSFWDGKIAQVRVYDSALTAQEVADNYNATKSRYGL